MKKIAIILALILSTITATAATFGPLDISEWHISGVRPTSFSSLDGNVAIELSNRGPKYSLSEISAIIYTKTGEMFIIGSADAFQIPKGKSTVTINGHGSLSSYSVLLSLIKNPSIKPADYTADISVTVKKGIGRPHKVTLTRVPLSTFLK